MDPWASPDERERLRAAETLATDRSPGAALLLAGALGDPSWRVRQAAVVGLVQNATQESVASAFRAFHAGHRDLGLLNSALSVLTAIGADPLPLLVGALADPEANVRTYAALTLGNRGDTAAVLDLLPLLEDPDTNVRCQVIEALGQLRTCRAVDALVTLAESGDFALAFPALVALAAIGDGRVAHRLVPLLKDDLLQSAVIDALGQLGDEESVGPLASLLHENAVPAGSIARALTSLHDRHELRFREGAYSASLARAGLGGAGSRHLIAALKEASPADLPALTRVLGWLDEEGVNETLAQFLSHPAAREAAIEALVRKGRSVSGLLIEQLDAEQPEVRQAAALGLGRIGDASAVPALLRALDDPEIAAVVAGALAHLGDARAYSALLNKLGHDDVGVRRAVVAALNSLGHPEKIPDLARLLRDPSPLVRESAAQTAGYLGSPELVDSLLSCCRDKEESVRRAALEQWSWSDDERVIPTLAEALRHPSPGTRAAAARALAASTLARVLPLLEKSLADTDPWVRYFAVRSASRHGPSPLASILIRMAQDDPAPQVRIVATEALGHVGGEEVIPLLIQLTEAKEDDQGRAALNALGLQAHPDGLPALRAALGMENAAKKIEAVRSLGAIRQKEAVELLRRVAIANWNDEARAAVVALGRLPFSEAVGALIDLAESPARRDLCIQVLAGLDDERIDWLACGLEHESADVRRAVVEALVRKRSPRTADHLKAALEDAEPAVRYAALAGLTRTGLRTE